MEPFFTIHKIIETEYGHVSIGIDHNNKSFDIFSLWVLPVLRRRGYGRKLIMQALDSIKEANKELKYSTCVLYVHSIEDKAIPQDDLIEFYSSCGFVFDVSSQNRMTLDLTKLK